MRKLFVFAVLVGATGCGSSTTASGTGSTPTPNPGSVAFCSQFTAGDGLTCDTATNPPTLKVNFGTTATTVAPGNVLGSLNPNTGLYLGSFVPSTAAQGNPVTLSAPGGQFPAGSALATGADTAVVAGGVGQIIYNAVSGRIGVRAGNEICSEISDWNTVNTAIPAGAVATGHVCSSQELLNNVHNGKIPVGSTGMIYNTTPFVPYTGTAATNLSANGDCGGWTYNSADFYQGTVFNVVTQTHRNNFGTTGGTEAANAVMITFTSGQKCSVAQPIACCQ
jgi:hypothetical protein